MSVWMDLYFEATTVKFRNIFRIKKFQCKAGKNYFLAVSAIAEYTCGITESPQICMKLFTAQHRLSLPTG